MKTIVIEARSVGCQPCNEYRFLVIRGTLYVGNVTSHPLLLHATLPNEPVHAADSSRLAAAGVVASDGTILWSSALLGVTTPDALQEEIAEALREYIARCAQGEA